MKKANEEIRNEMKSHSVTFWMLADSLGVSEGTLYRWFRHELPNDKKEQILEKVKAARG